MTTIEPARNGSDTVCIKPSIPALVLECHHGSLGIARSLGRLGVNVYGVGRDRRHPVYRSRYFCKAFEWDLVGRPAEATVDFLLNLGKTLGRRSLLIPTSDETTLLVARNSDALAERFVFAKQSPVLIEKLTSKRDNYYLAKSAGVPVAESRFPTSIDDVCQFAEAATFPVMLKGIEGRKLFERVGHKMMLVHSPDELIDCYRQWEDPADPNLMLQEYIPGGDDTVWMFNGYFDRQSECRAAFTGRKLRQTPPYKGSTSLGVCEPNDTVARMTIRFMREIGYTGILDIGYRYDARDGRYKLLDPNPRIGSTFRLFVGKNGMDVVRYLYMDMTGQPLPLSKARYGRKWLVEEYDFESFTIYHRNGELGWFDWLWSFRGVEETAWFALDDLRPFWPTAASIVKRAARWFGRMLRGIAMPAAKRGLKRPLHKPKQATPQVIISKS